MKERERLQKEAPDNPQFPKNDNGENYIFSLLARSLRPPYAALRILIAIVSARTVDEAVSRRGACEGEESDTVMEILDEYEEQFLKLGRKP